MSETAADTAPPLDESARPKLPRYARLHFDKARDRWVLLVPERVMIPDETAIEIIKQCDGEKTIAEIIDGLADKYAAERDQIAADVTEMLQDLANKGFLIDMREEDKS